MKRLPILFLLIIMSINLNAQSKESSNKHFWHTMTTTASPETIWQIWIDVPNWKLWDVGLKDASMKDEFKKGAKGKIISLEDRSTKFKVVDYDLLHSYTFKTNLPLGGLYVKRYVEVKNGQTNFTHEVWFSGLTGSFFAKRFGEKFRKMLPEAMGKIKELAEK